MMENQRTVREASQKLIGVDEARQEANIRSRTSGWMSAIPRRLTLALAFNGTGLLATIPFLLKATSLTTAVFSSLAMPCFAAGFLIYTVAVIRDLHEHGVL
jgi:hypothetical protein